MKTQFILAICFGALIANSANANTLDLDSAVAKTLIPEQRYMAQITPQPEYQPTLKPGEKALSVTAWVDKEDAIYHLGDTVTFSIQSNKDAYITLLDIGTSGETHVIFPNKFQPNNYVPAGKTINIPRATDKFHFRVGGKKGSELIKVIATSASKVVIADKYLKDSGPFQAVVTKDINAFANEINEVLNDPKNPSEWDEYGKVLFIR